ncbi:MAG TPA: GNAT family N-acetyltransferase [Polyangiaceae bacterium]|nr:GNAT family N-acetyltransferase [Polyangiaceae bacterium]
MTSSTTLRYPAVDLALAQRLERAEVLATIAYVEARGSLQPGGRGWLHRAGVHAVFDGPSSPLTQSFGLGAFEPPTSEVFEELESFFSSRGVATAHEVSALASPSTWDRLSARGYSPLEASTVLLRPTAHPPAHQSKRVAARLIASDEGPSWCRVLTAGLASESAELASAVDDLAPVMARCVGAHCFIAELDGAPVAAGIVAIQNGVAVLGGASTLPAARRQGAQAALLQARLEYAAELGVDLAMLVAAPGSSSQRNAERKGFRPAYVRSKWVRPLGPEQT